MNLLDPYLDWNHLRIDRLVWHTNPQILVIDATESSKNRYVEGYAYVTLPSMVRIDEIQFDTDVPIVPWVGWCIDNEWVVFSAPAAFKGEFSQGNDKRSWRFHTVHGESKRGVRRFADQNETEGFNEFGVFLLGPSAVTISCFQLIPKKD